jgi:hypothetical protein
MTDLQVIADRVEIEALRGEFTDASMMRDWDRFASLFAPDGAWRMPHYHDRYRRTPEGWKFSERVYEIRYADTTPLTGAPP